MRTERVHRPVGYLMKTYPKLSETFILHEILALEHRGLALQIFALNQPQERTVHAITAQVKAKVTYLPTQTQPLRCVWAHLALLVRHPRRYGRGLYFWAQQEAAVRGRTFWQAGYLAWALARAGIAHLHAHFANEPADVAEIVHLLSGIPYSMTAHAKDIYLSPPAVLARKMSRATFVVTCTEYNRHFLQALAHSGTSMHRIYHGLDPQRFQPAQATHTDAPQALSIILSVGRLREKKGFPVLLHACHALHKIGYTFQCQIVGYGPLQAELERQIAQLGLHGIVHLVGRLTQDELIERYRRATLFVLPCQIADDGDRDGIPNVLVEAMAMQLPVVSTPVSGIPELVKHGQNGLLVPQQDAEALAKALALLLDRPELREAFGRAGRAKVCQQFSTEHNIAQLHDLLRRALRHT